MKQGGGFMENVEKRHDITDAQWALIAPLLPGQRGQWGGIAKDNRKFINGVFWILRTGAPWRDLPSRYGKRGVVCQRFHRWRDSGRREKILEALSQNTDFEWIMIEDEPLQGSSARGWGKGRPCRAAQKGAEHKNPPCRGRERQASQNADHGGDQGRLQGGGALNGRNLRGRAFG